MTVHVEHQPTDKCFAVFIGGDDDPEGVHDQMFSYGTIDGRKVTQKEARVAALEYARTLED